MNFKKQAEKLERFLADEFNKELPVAVIDQNTLIYKNYKIKKLKTGEWGLFKKGAVGMIDKFDLRASALMAAKAHETNRIPQYFEIQNLDRYYRTNARDAAIFNYRMKKCKDNFDKDLAMWRWEITHARAEDAKSQITRKFKSVF